MKILTVFPDGTYTSVYEKGDRVIITDKYFEDYLIKIGNRATVVQAPLNPGKHDIVGFVTIRTDDMVRGDWGGRSIAPWFIEPTGLTKARIPGQIKAWKTKQMRDLLSKNAVKPRKRTKGKTAPNLAQLFEIPF